MTWAPDYATASEARAWLRINDAVDDAHIARAITAASRAVDKACGRQFGILAAATEWTYDLEYDRRRGLWFSPIDDLATKVGLVVKVLDTATTSYRLEPPQAVDKGMVWTYLVLDPAMTGTCEEQSLKVTASWGWPAVPAAVQQATLLQTSRFLARRDSPYGTTGSPAADGGELRLLAALDPDVRVSLDPYCRRVWAR
jgi:hypothetical protein